METMDFPGNRYHADLQSSAKQWFLLEKAIGYETPSYVQMISNDP